MLEIAAQRPGAVKGIVGRLDDGLLGRRGEGNGKLFIRCKSTERDIINKCTKVLRKYPGNSPVMFRFEDIGKTIAHKEIRSCEISPPLIDELFGITGEKNTAVAAHI